MSTGWWVVALLGTVTVACKAAGPVALGGWRPPERAAAVLDLVFPVVLAALLVVAVFVDGRELRFDARVAGLLAAIAALAWKAPPLVVVVVAVATTAATRFVL